MEVLRWRGETGKYEFDFSGQRTWSILENYRLENLLYGFLRDVPGYVVRARKWNGVRKKIRSGATMRKTQRRETHRACRRRRELRNGVRRQEKRDLYSPCYFSHSCTCLASDRTTPKRGRNCYTTLRQNFFVSRATCLVHAYNKKSL